MQLRRAPRLSFAVAPAAVIAPPPGASGSTSQPGPPRYRPARRQRVHVPDTAPFLPEEPPNERRGPPNHDELNPDQRRAQKAAVYSYNLELKRLARARDLQGSLTLLSNMREMNLWPDKYSYSTVLTCCRKVRATDVAFSLYKSMQEERVRIDNHILVNLLSIAGSASPPRIDTCHRLFRSAKSKPSVIMCNVLMDALARCGRVDDCMATLNYMALHGIQPDKYTVSAVVKAYVRAGQNEKAFQRLKQMHAGAIETSAAAFDQLMDAYGKLGAMDKAIEVYDTMVVLGVAPTQVTYNILIGACIHTHNVSRAFEIFEEMRHTTPFLGDRYTYNILMKCCIAAGEGGEALRVYSMLKQRSFLPNQVSYRLVLQAAGQIMDIEATLNVAEDMERNGCVPREDTCATLVAAAIRCSDLESALRFSERYLSSKAEFSSEQFFETILDALRGFEQHRKAKVELHRDFEQTGTVVKELAQSWRRRALAN